MILYRLLLGLALPVLLGLAALRGPAGALRQRLGLVPAPPDAAAPRLWLHGASVGELTSARWVLAGLARARPRLRVLVTANTATALAMVQGWGIPGVQAALAPVDSAGAPGRIIARWKPRALILIENELWPARLDTARRAGVPVLVIGARLSQRSADRWAHLPGLAARMLAALTWVSAQDPASQQRLRAMGLPDRATGPDLDLKALAMVAAPPGPALPGPAPRETVCLAASTHPGEEEVVLRGFAGQSRFGHLIIAPRHPSRGDAIAALLTRQGLAFARRSDGAAPSPDRPVFLADTLGEMERWYAMAGVCLIGGSLVPKGGHTPYEPGRHGCALLHGPSTRNFQDIFARLDAAGGARPVTPEGLAAGLQSLTPEVQARMAQAAAPLLKPRQDGDWLVRELLVRAGL